MAVRDEAPQQLRLTELLGSISLATDLGTGQPLGHALRTCALATALATAMGCSTGDVRTVHHASLRRFLGCTSDAAETAALAGGDDLSFNAGMAPALMGSDAELLGRLTRVVGAGRPLTTRARLLAGALADPGGGARSMATHCEVGAMLGTRMGMPAPVVEALAHAYERWDGKGFPGGRQGDAVPMAVRIFVVARDVDLAAGWGRTRWTGCAGGEGGPMTPPSST
ncbi:MAG TPA: HD domain-containing phosphohydrolase [Euzebya sp.]|nr:HD domain-containing phosphohydrolase [Euzebya sp.]